MMTTYKITSKEKSEYKQLSLRQLYHFFLCVSRAEMAVTCTVLVVIHTDHVVMIMYSIVLALNLVDCACADSWTDYYRIRYPVRPSCMFCAVCNQTFVQCKPPTTYMF